MNETKPIDHYDAIYRAFRWQVPATFNMAQVCCRRWAAQDDATERIAISAHSMRASGIKSLKNKATEHTAMTYAELAMRANQLSHVLARTGVARGDRVAIVMPQRPETAVAYMAVLQMGAVAVPLSMLFGPEALEYRLRDSGAVVAVVDESTVDNVVAVRKKCRALRTLVGAGEAVDRCEIDLDFESALMPSEFEAAQTKADEGAVLIYTSGTTGPPKGALIPHRALIGNLTGFVASQNWFGFDPFPSQVALKASSPGWERVGEGAIVHMGQEPNLPEPKKRSVFWSPADWAWTGGLMDALLPTLYFGREIVAYNGRFSPEAAFDILQTHRVTHTFLFPTALKSMMKAYPKPREQFKLQLQAIMSAGEAVGDAVYAYCEHELGVKVNEMFGQTEINYIVGNCNRLWPSKPGSMGKGYPGHRVAVIDESSREVADGEVGEVAVSHTDVHGDADPVFFLGYWNNEAATKKKTTAASDGTLWCRTGDLATRDADGYLWYQGRADDMFKAAGYRIGPSEVENCLVKHPAVLNAAVVPKPDKERGAVVKAYVVLTPEFIAKKQDLVRASTLKSPQNLEKWQQELVLSIQQHVKGQLAPYEYPKEIEFIDALPMTTTGKVQRRVLRLQEEERARHNP